MGRITYNSNVPQGAGAVGENFSPPRVFTPRINGMCFANMQTVSDLDMACAAAPADHALITDALKGMGKRHAQQAVDNTPRGQRAATIRASLPKFTKGASVRDNNGRKGIIIKAAAGYTSRKKTPVHKIIDKHDDIWFAKETDLTLIY